MSILIRTAGFLFLCALALYLSTLTVFAENNPDNSKVDHMLMPSVTFSMTSGGTGTGTAIKVDPVLGTFIMTAYHVVVKEEQLWVQLYGEEEKREVFIHSFDEAADLAVVIMPFKAEHVAIMGSVADISIFDDIICVGNALGRGIVPSMGIVSDLDYFTSDVMSTRVTCGISIGSSGGSLNVQRESDGVWVYVGMPAMVSKKQIRMPFGSPAFTTEAYLGYALRIQDILAFLVKNNVLNSPELAEIQ